MSLLNGGKASMATASKTGLLERGTRFLLDQFHRMQDSTNDPDATKIINFLQPEELKKKLKLSISDDEGDSDDKILKLCETVAEYSMRSSHVHNYNQMWHGVDEPGLLGSWFADTFNTQAFTYEVAPVFSLIENYLLEHIGSDLVGYRLNDVDGTMCPGGSLANMYAMSLARHRVRPETKLEGMLSNNNSSPLVALTSRESHYSIRKGMAFMGFGENNLVLVDCDQSGRMLGAALEHSIQTCIAEGRTPFFVNATAGSTVLGAFDPLDELADICQRHGNLWLHCDAAWGGALLLVPELRQKLLRGIERCDSLLWNPHKMLCLPLQCSIFLTRHKGMMQKAHCANAGYLFQTDKMYDASYDTGDKVIQCGRHVDALKLYLKWRKLGRNGLRQEITRAFEQAAVLAELIKKHENFELVLPYSSEQCTNVCFWYVPPAMRRKYQLTLTGDGSSKKCSAVRKMLEKERNSSDGSNKVGSFERNLQAVAPEIKKRMTMAGTLMIGYQPSAVLNVPNFFRMMLHAVPHQTEADMKFVVDEIDRLGRDIDF